MRMANVISQVLPLKQQYEIMDGFLKERLESVLPQLMKQEGIDMWLVLAREYNEDPVFSTMIPALMRTASRLSCLMFSLNAQSELECLSICRPNPGLERFYKRVWDSKAETQLECINRIIKERNPQRIGINISKDFALADGLTKALYDELTGTLAPEFHSRLVSAEKLCVGWLEKRCAAELCKYPDIYEVALNIIDEAFSDMVIKPGTTTTNDVEWWIMQRINDLGLTAWFTPTVDLQRKGAKDKMISDTVILPGDILHCDVGIYYLGLCTDTQRLAYVLERDETQVPEGLIAALGICNDFQDIVTRSFAAGKSGNEILKASLAEAEAKCIKAMLYTHPVGCHGHGAGPLIGLYDNQDSLPVKGDYTLKEDTCYALELNTSSCIPEWDGQEVTVYLEETIAFTKSGCNYIKNRQEEFIVI